jgi:hypothetical protein
MRDQAKKMACNVVVKKENGNPIDHRNDLELWRNNNNPSNEQTGGRRFQKLRQKEQRYRYTAPTAWTNNIYWSMPNRLCM